jgi:hypothetical protein
MSRIAINYNQQIDAQNIGVSRDCSISYLKSLNLDEKTYNTLFKDMAACPDSALSGFMQGLNNKIQNIRSKNS